MKKPRVYLAGPMTGLPGDNIKKFEEITAELRENFTVISPAEMAGEDPHACTYEQHMKRDFTLLMECDIVALLPNWQESRGALHEVMMARILGKKFMCAVTEEEIFVGYFVCMDFVLEGNPWFLGRGAKQLFEVEVRK